MPNNKQKVFQEMVLGVLIYAVVLGFFEDYTSFISTWSYSITFSAALVMQILTYITFKLKLLIVNHFKNKEGSYYKVALVFGVWLVMFFSKFVFLFVIESIFGDSVELSGFIGLVIIIATMVIVKKTISSLYTMLGS